MITLEFEQVRATYAGRSVGPFDARYHGQHILLFGNWSWLRAHLAGDSVVTSGNVRCLEEDGRAATIRGAVGVSLSGLEPPLEWTVHHFIAQDLELLGQPRRDARARAEQVLAQLALASLGDRRLMDLNPAETFAAHAAFAVSSSPDLLILDAPLLLDETRQFEIGLLELLSRDRKVAMACTRRDEWLFQWADEFAYCSGSAPASTTLPIELMAAPSRRYRLKPFGPREGLVAALDDRGVAHEELADGSLIVTLPEEGSPNLIADAALQADVALSEWVQQAAP